MKKNLNVLLKDFSISNQLINSKSKLLRVCFLFDKLRLTVSRIWFNKDNFVISKKLGPNTLIKISKGVGEKFLMFIDPKEGRIVEPLNQIIYIQDPFGRLLDRKSTYEFYKKDFKDQKFEILSIEQLNELTSTPYQGQPAFGCDRLNARMIVEYYKNNFEIGEKIEFPQKDVLGEKNNPYGNFGQNLELNVTQFNVRNFDNRKSWIEKLFRKRESHKDFFNSIKVTE